MKVGLANLLDDLDFSTLYQEARLFFLSSRRTDLTVRSMTDYRTGGMEVGELPCRPDIGPSDGSERSEHSRGMSYCWLTRMKYMWLFVFLEQILNCFQNFTL